MERGGYRQIRVLSAGAGEEVLLCRRAAEDSADPVVVRLVGEEAADAAIAVDGAVDSPHLAPLLDLFDAGDDRYGLVYARLPLGSLAELLARRATLAPGEAVTILVSVARGIEALHHAGRTHGGLRATGVLFDEAGTPVLAGLCGSRPLDPASGRADCQALSAIAAAVLARVGGAEAVLSELTQSGDGVTPKRMQERLFAFAEPRPVDYPRSASPLTIEQLLPSRATPPQTPPPASPAGWLPALAIADRLRRAVVALRSVRRRVWVPAALTGVCLVLALLLVPTGDAPPAAGAPRPLRTTTAEMAAPEPAAPEAPDRAVLRGDDPVAAARALAAARDQCAGSGGGACAAAVDQPGSALLEADTAGDGPPPPTLPLADGEPFVQRTGDAAVIEQGGVTLLLVRAEGEWRLRDVFRAETP